MNTLLLIVLIIGVLIIIGNALTGRRSSGRVAKEATVYYYHRKDYLMTKSENDFFIVLKELLQDRYQVFPQIHLSAVLDQKVKGQNWNSALRHINSKSVDFVVCDKSYARPLLAIELDDFSHDANERRTRDAEVERIFQEANLPLLRFRDYKTMSRDTVASQIESTLNNHRVF